MTHAESILASRLLDMAAERFNEHGCNDMDPEVFEDLSAADLAELEAGYNAWNHGETGETCGDPEMDFVKLINIGDNMWMAYLAAVVCRKDFKNDIEWSPPDTGGGTPTAGCGKYEERSEGGKS